ncbi:unnamed protein product, partial [Owenia fusiformis]
MNVLLFLLVQLTPLAAMDFSELCVGSNNAFSRWCHAFSSFYDAAAAKENALDLPDNAWQDYKRGGERDRHMMRFGRSLLDKDKRTRYIRFGRSVDSSLDSPRDAMLTQALMGFGESDARQKRALGGHYMRFGRSVNHVLNVDKKLIENEISKDDNNYDKRFMRFGKKDGEDEKRFMRFGKKDGEDEKRFMRFGKKDGEDEKRFMRFGKKDSDDEKRFMRFGKKDGENEKRFMRFGKKDGEDEKRFMRFGKKDGENEKRFMRFGKKDGEDEKRFMRFG